MFPVLRFTLAATLLTLGASCATEAPLSDAEEVVRIEEMYAEYQQDFPGVTGISASELLTLASERDLVLVDIRTPEEQQVSMIPGAITAQQFEANREQYRDAEVVTYCTIGARSGRYAKSLSEQGLHVRNLEGSLLAWTHAGGTLLGPDGPTQKVHVYGRQWSLVADGYEPVW